MRSLEDNLSLPSLIHKTNNFNNDSRNKNLFDAFFGTTSSATIQQMEDELEDISIDDDTKFNKFSNQTKSKLKTTQNKLISYGLDGNLKNEIKYDDGGMLKNELDLEQQQYFEEQKQQNLLKLKPKLTTRYNRLNNNKKVDVSVTNDEKKLKYKKYLQDNKYFSSNEEEYPLKKLKLVSQKSVNKQYIPLDESIMKDKLNNLIDLGLFNARRFRINWLHPLKYSCLSLLTEESQRRSAIFSLTSPNLMLQMKQLNMNSAVDNDNTVVKNNCIQYLRIQLNNSTKEINNTTKIPHFKQNIGNEIIFEFQKSTQKMRNEIGN